MLSSWEYINKWSLITLLHYHSFLCSIFAVFITLSQYYIKEDLKQGLVYVFWPCLPQWVPAPSLLPAALTQHTKGNSPRNVRPAIFQSIYNGKAPLQRELVQEQKGLQSDLHCACNSHAFTGGESRKRVHKDVLILLPLTPEWSQLDWLYW